MDIKEFLQRENISEEEAIDMINRWRNHAAKRKEITRNYYLKNKEKIDDYHRKYRMDNPIYRKKRNEKAKEYYRKKRL